MLSALDMAGVEPLITGLISTLYDSSLNCDSKAHGIIISIVSCFKTEQNVSEVGKWFRLTVGLFNFVQLIL